MVTGVAFGTALLASAPAIAVYFTLPYAWAALVSLSFFTDVAPWLDTVRAIGPMVKEVLSPTQCTRRHRPRPLDGPPAPDRRLPDHPARGLGVRLMGR